MANDSFDAALTGFRPWAKTHPDAASVLTVIGKNHPDNKIAKAARKAAYKAKTRQIAQRR